MKRTRFGARIRRPHHQRSSPSPAGATRTCGECDVPAPRLPLPAPEREWELDALERAAARRVELLLGDGSAADLFDRDGEVDAASHAALLLACALAQAGLPQWFHRQEVLLFHRRLRRWRDARVAEGPPYLWWETQFGLRFERCSDGGAAALAHQWACRTAAVAAVGVGDDEDPLVAVVPLDQATRLVGRRCVVVNGGNALVPAARMDEVVVERFGLALRARLDVATWRGLPALLGRSDQPALQQMLDGLARSVRRAAGADPHLDGARRVLEPARRLTLASLEPRMAEGHLPLCARTLVRELRHKHKLKYDGRLQLWLFLKGSGTPCAEVLDLWASEVPQVEKNSKFDKQEYSIRHLFGREGKRREHSGYSCHQIMSAPPPRGAEQCHGCPFLHRAQDQVLRDVEDTLRAVEADPADARKRARGVVDALDPGADGDAQPRSVLAFRACQRHLDALCQARDGCLPDGPRPELWHGTKPDDFYRRSVAVATRRADAPPPSPAGQGTITPDLARCATTT